jgi:hypothetical protein
VRMSRLRRLAGSKFAQRKMLEINWIEQSGRCFPERLALGHG